MKNLQILKKVDAIITQEQNVQNAEAALNAARSEFEAGELEKDYAQEQAALAALRQELTALKMTEFGRTFDTTRRAFTRRFFLTTRGGLAPQAGAFKTILLIVRCNVRKDESRALLLHTAQDFTQQLAKELNLTAYCEQQELADEFRVVFYDNDAEQPAAQPAPVDDLPF